MRPAVMTILICATAGALSGAGESPHPNARSSIAPIAAPKDRASPGEIHLTVDASDLERRIARVHESVSGIGAETVLLYPKWLPGTHAPEGPIDRIAGLRITANGAQISSTRDPVDVYALRVH